MPILSSEADFSVSWAAARSVFATAAAVLTATVWLLARPWARGDDAAALSRLADGGAALALAALSA